MLLKKTEYLPHVEFTFFCVLFFLGKITCKEIILLLMSLFYLLSTVTKPVLCSTSTQAFSSSPDCS